MNVLEQIGGIAVQREKARFMCARYWNSFSRCTGFYGPLNAMCGIGTVFATRTCVRRIPREIRYCGGALNMSYNAYGKAAGAALY